MEAKQSVSLTQCFKKLTCYMHVPVFISSQKMQFSILVTALLFIFLGVQSRLQEKEKQGNKFFFILV